MHRARFCSAKSPAAACPRRARAPRRRGRSRSRRAPRPACHGRGRRAAPRRAPRGRRAPRPPSVPAPAAGASAGAAWRPATLLRFLKPTSCAARGAARLALAPRLDDRLVELLVWSEKWAPRRRAASAPARAASRGTRASRPAPPPRHLARRLLRRAQLDGEVLLEGADLRAGASRPRRSAFRASAACSLLRARSCPLAFRIISRASGSQRQSVVQQFSSAAMRRTSAAAAAASFGAGEAPWAMAGGAPDFSIASQRPGSSSQSSSRGGSSTRPSSPFGASTSPDTAARCVAPHG